MAIRGVIFDLDGTLVDSALDFDQMRRAMGIEGSPPLLEALAEMPDERARHCRAMLAEFEHQGISGPSSFLVCTRFSTPWPRVG